MWYINGDGSCIALLGLSPLETILYSTALSYAKSIVFYRVVMLPFGYSVRETLLGALPDIINIKKKCIAAFDISLSIGFNLGWLLWLILCHLLTAFILY